MATKAFRSSVAATPVQAWALPNTGAAINIGGGVLALERGTAVLPNNAVACLTDGTAAAAGTLAYIPLGGTVTAVGAGPPAIPFSFGERGIWVDELGGLGVKLIPDTVGAGTVTGFFHGVEKTRR